MVITLLLTKKQIRKKRNWKKIDQLLRDGHSVTVVKPTPAPKLRYAKA